MKALRTLSLLAALLFPLVAAATPDEAVGALVASLKDAGSRPGGQPDEEAVLSLLGRLLPHLGGSSHSMVESMLRSARAAREQDETARKAFGAAALDKEDGYMPAARSLVFFAGFSMPLAMLRQGSAAEIVERSSAGDEASYRVRWRTTGAGERERVEEAFIAVRDGAAWKLLVPGFGSITFGTHTSGGETENHVERQKKPWSAAAMRAENEATQRRIESLTRLFDAMTADVKAGRFPTAKAYVEAIAARRQKM